MEVARSFLPGLREAIGVGLQLMQVQQNELAMQQALVDGTAPRAVTLESEKPDLLDTLKQVGKVPSEAEHPTGLASLDYRRPSGMQP